MKISHKIPLIVIGILVACFVFLVSVLVSSICLELHRYFELDLTHKARELRRIVDKKSEQALKAAAWFESSSELATALRKDDRSKAIELGKAAMEAFGLDYFVVTDGTGKVLARAHDPGKFDDSIAEQQNIKSALAGSAPSSLRKAPSSSIASGPEPPCGGARGG